MPGNEDKPVAGRVLLVRHGESEGNRTRTFTHSPLVDLTERGREQARATVSRIAAAYQPVRLISSPFKRALDTARILSEVLRLPVEVEPLWREQNLGELAGRPYDTVLEDPTFDFARTWAWRPPGGESLEDVRDRVAPAFDQVLRAAAERDVVVVSHAGVMQAVWAHVTGSWQAAPVPPNAALAVVAQAGKVPTIRFDEDSFPAEGQPRPRHRDLRSTSS